MLMKIWIDLTNSPHVNFFADMIKELQVEHEVLLTCRHLANTIEMLRMKGFEYHVVGKHYGASKLKKAIGFFVRIWQLFAFLRKKNVDVAISHSSFYSPLVARLLGVRSIYLNDNEHAAGNKISFLFANTIMIPEYLDIGKVEQQWGRRSKVIRYPGVKEAVYLWRDGKKQPSYQIQTERKIKQIYVRPEPWTAQYYNSEKNFMDQILIDLKDDFEVTVLPRGNDQSAYYAQERFQGINIPTKSLALTEIMDNCDLFIGAGGTMTREAAVLGTPTISIYQDKLLDVDRYLIEMKRITHKPDIDVDFVVKFIETHQRISPSNKLLVKGQKAYDLIKKTLLENTD